MRLIPLLPVVATVAVSLGACAHARSAEPGARAVFEGAALGYALELPPGAGFVAGPPPFTASTERGVVVRVTPVFVPVVATLEACWSRLASLGAEEFPSAGGSGAELAARAAAGLEREGGRRTHIAVRPRDASCLVLQLDGPARTPEEAAFLAAAAERASRTFSVSAPAEVMRAPLAQEAGFQLLDAEEDLAALARFEEALALDPSLVPARFGAGIAAFLAGKGHEARAIELLEAALALPASSEDGEPEVPAALHRDALVDLALARMATGQAGLARQRLAEAAARYPDDAVVTYNLACVLATGGDGDEAMYHLTRAVGLDAALASHAAQDADLASLRARPDFAALIGGATPAVPGD